MKHLKHFLWLSCLELAHATNPFDSFNNKTRELQGWLTNLGSGVLIVSFIVAMILYVWNPQKYIRIAINIAIAGVGIKAASAFSNWIMS